MLCIISEPTSLNVAMADVEDDEDEDDVQVADDNGTSLYLPLWY